MKFSWKIFIISYCILVVSISATSFYMLNKIYKDDVNQVIKQAEEDNKSMYTYAVAMNQMSSIEDMENSLRAFANAMTKDDNNLVFVGDENNLFKITGEIDVEDNSVTSYIVDTKIGRYVQVISHIESIYLMNRYSLNEVIAERDRNFEFYRSLVIILSAIMAVMLFWFSNYIANPIVKLTKIAEKISDGDYSVRTDASMKNMKSNEVKKLGETMNLMVENTNNNISELEAMLKKREEFIGDFTHEIKTPLTSIIGYGDMLRTYDLSAEKTREYGEYIYSEGKRLENLSLNLMQMIVLNNSKVDLQVVNTRDIFKSIQQNCRFLGEKYNVSIKFNIESESIKVEPSLYITVILNFIDNACKASSENQTVCVLGNTADDNYVVNVTDSGKGIAKEEIEKIMEPFYMVDKSRTRSQGGAGLGLALCQKIAELHKAQINISSVVGEGTTATLKIKKEMGQ